MGMLVANSRYQRPTIGGIYALRFSGHRYILSRNEIGSSLPRIEEDQSNLKVRWPDKYPWNVYNLKVFSTRGNRSVPITRKVNIKCPGSCTD